MRISDWSSDVCSSDLEILRHLIWFIYDNMESPDIAAPMLDDFRHTFGGDMSPGTGPGTIHAYTSDVIHAAQLEGSVVARSEEHTSELQSLMRISYSVFCLKKKKKHTKHKDINLQNRTT